MKKFLIAAALLALGLAACSKQEEAPVEASAPVAEVASEVASAPAAEVASDVAASDVAVASEASAAQ